jgi:hypothetical protein
MLQRIAARTKHKCKVYVKDELHCVRYVIVCTLHTASNNTQCY